MNLKEKIWSEAKTLGTGMTPLVVARVLSDSLEKDREGTIRALTDEDPVSWNYWDNPQISLTPYMSMDMAKEITKLNRDNLYTLLNLRSHILGKIERLSVLIHFLDQGWHDVIRVMGGKHIGISLIDTKQAEEGLLRHSEFLIDSGIFPDRFRCQDMDIRQVLYRWIAQDSYLQEQMALNPDRYMSIVPTGDAFSSEVEGLLRLFKINEKYMIRYFKKLGRIKRQWKVSLALEDLISSLSKDQAEMIIDQNSSHRVKGCMILNEHVRNDHKLLARCLKGYVAFESEMFPSEGMAINIPDGVFKKLSPADTAKLIKKSISLWDSSRIRFNPDVAFQRALPVLLSQPEMLETIKKKIETLRATCGMTIKDMAIKWAEKQEETPVRDVILSIIRDNRVDDIEKAMLIEIYLGCNQPTEVADMDILYMEKEYGRLKEVLPLLIDKAEG